MTEREGPERVTCSMFVGSRVLCMQIVVHARSPEHLKAKGQTQLVLNNTRYFRLIQTQI